MKLTFAVALLTVAFSQAAPVSTDTPKPSPLLGSWALDVGRLPMPPDQRPKSVTISFSDAGNARWTTDVRIVGGDGSTIHAVSTCPLDGAPTAATVVSPEADKVSVVRPEDDVLVMALSKDGKGRSTRTFSVAPDGKTLTETAVYLSDNGVPGIAVHYFNRIR